MFKRLIMKKIILIFILIPLISFSQLRENIVRMEASSTPFPENYAAGQLIRIVSDSALYQLDTIVAIGQTMTTVLSRPTWYKKVLTGIAPASTWTLGTNKQTSTVDTVAATVVDATFLRAPTITMGDAQITNISAWNVTKTDATTSNGASIGLSSSTNPAVIWTANTQTAGNSMDLDTASLYPSYGVPLNLGKSGTPFDTTFTNDLKVTNKAVIPTILGGSAASSGITYTSTSGTGTAAGIAHWFKGGTNGGTPLMTMLNDGKVGIGTSSPTQKLDVNGNLQLLYNLYFASGANAIALGATGLTYTVNNNVGRGHYFVTGNLERLRIEYGGNIGIGTTAPTNNIDVNGYARFRSKVWVGDSTGTYSYINPGDAAWTTSSSRTIKENITPVEVPDSLFNRVLAIGPKKYNFKLSNFLHDIPITAVCDSVVDETDTAGQTYRKLTSAEIQRDWKLLQHNDSLQAMAQAGKQYVGFIAEEMAELTHGSDKEINYMEVLAVIWQTQQALIRKSQEQEARLEVIETMLNIKK